MKTLILVVLSMVPVFAQLAVDREIAIGNAMSAEMGKALDNDAANQLMNRIVERLSRGIVLRLPVRLKLIAPEEAIASTLPGGMVVFSSGAIARADSEAELAAEIAHQIAHVQEPLDARLRAPLDRCLSLSAPACAFRQTGCLCALCNRLPTGKIVQTCLPPGIWRTPDTSRGHC